MSDDLTDTPRLGRRCCPTCEPGADPMREILDIVYCDDHQPDRHGLDDPEAPYGYSVQDGGVNGRVWCDLLHRTPR